MVSKNLMDKFPWVIDHLMVDSMKVGFLPSLQFHLIKVATMLKMSEIEVEKDFLQPTIQAP